MKWRVVKLLCIAGAGIVGILMTGEFLAAVLTAPFGWILGRVIELNAEMRRVEREGTIYTPVVNGEMDEEWEEWWWNEWKKWEYEKRHSPKYYYLLGNAFYYEDE